MRIYSRSFLLSLFATLIFAASANAQEAVNSGAWSDSSTWSGGALPQQGDTVTIGAGLDIVLDVTPPALHGLNINGKLSSEFTDNAANGQLQGGTIALQIHDGGGIKVRWRNLRVLEL